MFKKSIKTTILAAFLTLVVAASVSAMKMNLSGTQKKKFSKLVTSYFENAVNNPKAIIIKELGSLLRKRSPEILNMREKSIDVKGWTDNNKIYFRISKQIYLPIQPGLVEIVVTEKTREFKIDITIKPNHDGCIIDRTSGDFYVGRALDAYFYNLGSIIVEKNKSSYLKSNNKNAYMVRAVPSLFQFGRPGVGGTCAFHAIFNLQQLYINRRTKTDLICNYSFMLKREAFNKFFRNESKILGKTSSLTAFDIVKIVKNMKVKPKNFMTSILDVGEASNSKVLCLDGKSLKYRIEKFRKGATPQYLTVYTSKQKKIHGIRLDWDNINERKLSIENHSIAMKIEWKDKKKPMNSPVIMSVVDSAGARDNRYSAIVHWYYLLFVQSKLSDIK